MATTLPSSKPSSLLRQIGFISATALVVSNMVGTGIFGATGFMVGQLGSAKIILAAWAVGALFALAGAFSYSELGINFPSSGGEYVYLTRAYGPTWGFMTGWVSFFAGFSAPIAAAALTFAKYLGHFFPVLRQESDLTFRLGAAQVLASILILAFTALNCFGVGRVAKIQNALTGGKIAVVATFVAAAFLYGSGSWSHLSESAVRTTSTPIAAQFVITLLWVMVSYSGWNAATYVAEEVKRPERTLPAALAAGTALVTVLYLGLNLTFFYATPLESMKDHIEVGSLAASNLFGPGVAGVFAAMMALSIVSTVSAMVTIGPRVYYAMAQNGAFFRSAAAVHPKWRTPTVAIVSQGVCAALMTLTPFPQLFFFIGFSLTFFTVLSVASLFVFRRREGWQRLKPVSFCYPLIPVAYILVGTGMTLYGIFWQPKASLIALANIAAGAAVYRLWLRDRKP